MSGNKGFTLIELLVGIALSMIIAVSLTNVFRDGLRVYKLAEKSTPLYQEARVVLDRIARDVRNGLDVPGVAWTATPAGVSFATVGPTQKIEKVTYRVAAAETGLMQPATTPRAVLEHVRQELSPEAAREPEVTLMTSHPTVIEWEYAYAAPHGDVLWLSAWKTIKGRSTPSGVRVRLTLYDGQSEGQTFVKTIFMPAGRELPWAG